LIPIPGASATGYFAQIPITKQPIADARPVATNTAFSSIPVALKMDVFTNKI